MICEFNALSIQKLDIVIKPGIYFIVNTINHKYYIGSSKNIYQRWHKHLYELRNKKHPCKHLQSSFDKYGFDRFNFQLIETVDDLNSLIEREQYYLDNADWAFLYNTRKIAETSFGVKWSDEARLKISLLRKGIPRTEKARINAKQGNIDRILNAEIKDKCIGVTFHKITNKYRARIMVNGKSLALGTYDSFEEARDVRKKAEQEFWIEKKDTSDLIKDKQSNSKKWIVTSPDNTEFIITNLEEFCKIHNLNASEMGNVASSRRGRKKYKNWNCKKYEKDTPNIDFDITVSHSDSISSN